MNPSDWSSDVCSSDLLLGQTIVGAIDPMIVFADEIAHPQTVTVELDLAHQYVVEDRKSVV